MRARAPKCPPACPNAKMPARVPKRAPRLQNARPRAQKRNRVLFSHLRPPACPNARPGAKMPARVPKRAPGCPNMCPANNLADNCNFAKWYPKRKKGKCPQQNIKNNKLPRMTSLSAT